MNTSNSAGIKVQVTGCGKCSRLFSLLQLVMSTTKGGVIASTTGNIYGVYDMSGGDYEYTSATMVSPTSWMLYTAPPGITYSSTK